MNERLKYYLRANTKCDDLQIEKIAGCFTAKTVKRNTVLLSSGDICNEFYFVQSGCIRTFYITKQGKERTRIIALDGTVATCLSSFISQQSSFEFVDAVEDSQLCCIKRKDFYQLVEDIPGWAFYYKTLLEMGYLFQNKKIEDLLTLPAPQRYEKLLKDNPEYIKRLSNKILATYLDISQETLSRLKSK